MLSHREPPPPFKGVCIFWVLPPKKEAILLRIRPFKKRPLCLWSCRSPSIQFHVRLVVRSLLLAAPFAVWSPSVSWAQWLPKPPPLRRSARAPPASERRRASWASVPKSSRRAVSAVSAVSVVSVVSADAWLQGRPWFEIIQRVALVGFPRSPLKPT